MRCISALAALAVFVPAAFAVEGPARFQLRTLPGLMKYDEGVLRVKPGQAVEIEVRNDDQLPHNLVVLSAAGVFMEVAQKAWELGERGPVRQWIPDDARVLAHTAMIDPGQTGRVAFTAPDREGELDFVCTFPGHAMIMNGRLLVSEAPPPGLRDLTCMVFKGAWDRLPDFLGLPQENKVAVDEVNDNLIGVEVTGMRDGFGLVFNGNLEVPTDGEYTFYLGSDDGSRLTIDDQEIIGNDGVHAHTEKRKKVTLATGLRRVRVEYFQQAGEQSLTLAWSGPGFSRAWLSKEKQSAGEEYPEIVLAPSDGRPVIYRGFLSPHQGSRRLIAVGTPAQVNYAFDQDQLRLALMWKGAFLDVGRHWTGRGAGEVSPLGFGVFAWPAGEDFAVLADDAVGWPEVDETGRARHSHFRGYRLDAAGSPTFRYTVHGVEIEDTLRPAGSLAAATEALVRTVLLHAPKPVDGMFFGLPAADPAEPDPDGAWRFPGNVAVTLENAAPPVHRAGQLMVPLVFDAAGRARLVVTYRWF